MVGSDALLTVAELAIALAGFSAVIAVFATHGQFSPADRSRFVWLFTTAFVAALLAYVPIILNQAGLSGASLWRTSSAVMIGAWLVSMGPWAALVRRNRLDPSSLPLGVGEPFGLLIPALLNLVLQIANTSGTWWAPSPACYLVGTLVWLYAAALVFLGILLYRPSA